jgi:preprotein translocase subunit SecA
VRKSGPELKRNDPCWCGSGKKYKNCHMQSDRARAGGQQVPAA